MTPETLPAAPPRSPDGAAGGRGGLDAEAIEALSHAARTPLNAILGYAQLLRMADLAPRERAHAEAILAAGEDLLALLDRALDGAGPGEPTAPSRGGDATGWPALPGRSD